MAMMMTSNTATTMATIFTVRFMMCTSCQNGIWRSCLRWEPEKKTLSATSLQRVSFSLRLLQQFGRRNGSGIHRFFPAGAVFVGDVHRGLQFLLRLFLAAEVEQYLTAHV